MNLVDYNSNQIVDREGGSKQWDSGSYERIRFRNGYGASIITGGSAYGRGDTLEIAVIRFLSESNDDFELCYDTPITGDVIGHLSHDRARSILKQIAALPPDAKALPGAMLDYES
jgi:hypothetical protein